MGGPRPGGGGDDGRDARAGLHAMAAPAEASSWSLALSPYSSSPPPMLRADDGNEDADWETLDRQDFVEKAAREHEGEEGGVSHAAAANSLTIVLVGRSGNGKSATGNSILKKKVFKSARSHLAVTSTCELAHVDRSDGRHINVVDTPGLFDPATSPEYLSKEISRCIALARDGVHALLLVLSTRNRFTAEEMAAVDSLQVIFGDKVVDYMIIVFTGGDELEEEGQSLDDYLPDVHSSGPESLQALLRRCGDRKAVFDNKTKDPAKQERQTQELLNMVDSLVQSNGGQPYTNVLFQEAKEAAEAAKEAKEVELNERIAEFHYDDDKAKEMFKAWREEMQASHAEQLRLVTSMVEEGLRKQAEEQQRALKEQQVVLEERLARETVAREEAENAAKEEKRQANDELQRMKAELDELKVREATLSASKEEKQQAHNDLQRMKAELDQLKQREQIRQKMDKELNRGCVILMGGLRSGAYDGHKERLQPTGHLRMKAPLVASSSLLASPSRRAVTSTCELVHVDLSDGRLINVIDPPGLFDPVTSHENSSKEMSQCIALARDGVHALLLVLSIRNRFTAEEVAAVDRLQVIFMALLQRCGDRKVVLDNKTKDPTKQVRQSQELLDMVESLVQINGGQPYINALLPRSSAYSPAKKSLSGRRQLRRPRQRLLNRWMSLPMLEEMLQACREEMQALHEEQMHQVAIKVGGGLRKQVEEQQRTMQARQVILEESLAKEIRVREVAERAATEEREQAGRVAELLQEHSFQQLHVMEEQRIILQEVLDGKARVESQSAAREERLQADQAILESMLEMEKKAREEANSNLLQMRAELGRLYEQQASLRQQAERGCTIL
eukprot:SM000020S06054  [mRNA]  locus=s20:700496:708748:+ [translate_table: standard]